MDSNTILNALAEAYEFNRAKLLQAQQIIEQQQATIQELSAKLEERVNDELDRTYDDTNSESVGREQAEDSV